MSPSYCRAVLVLLLTVICAATVEAQSRRCDVVRADVAIDARATLRAARDGTLQQCQQTHQTITAGIRALRAQGMSPPLFTADDLWTLLLPASTIEDQALLDEAALMAADQNATELYRATAIVLLASQAGAALEWYAGSDVVTGSSLLTVPLDDGVVCGAALQLGQRPTGAVPLEPDYKLQVARVLDPIALNPGESQLLRRLAECGRPALSSVPPQISATDVQLIYVCDNAFRIENSYSMSLPFRYQVAGSSTSVWVTVEGGSEVKVLGPGPAGTLNLYYDDDLIESVVNANTTCVP